MNIGIIGCGNMGEAIARGIINSGLVSGAELYLYDLDKDKAGRLKNALHANSSSSSKELADSCETVLLAVKPQDAESLLRDIGQAMDASKLLISIAAGVTIKKLKKNIENKVRTVRAMPNMAALIGQSISVLCYDDNVTADDEGLARKIFESVGDVVEVEEAHMDAVTAVSGSGPAYFFYLTEILEKSAAAMGIEKHKARQLALKTAIGSAALLQSGGADAEKLRERVTSKGGTTEAAFRFFAEKKLREILQGGISEAARRSKELSEKG